MSTTTSTFVEPLPAGLIAELLDNVNQRRDNIHLMRQFLCHDPNIEPAIIRFNKHQSISLQDGVISNPPQDDVIDKPLQDGGNVVTNNPKNQYGYGGNDVYDKESLYDYIFSNITELPNGTKVDTWDPLFLLLVNHKLFNLTSIHLIIDWYHMAMEPDIKKVMKKGLIEAFTHPTLLNKLESLNLYFGGQSQSLMDLFPNPVTLPSLTSIDLSLNSMTPQYVNHLTTHLQCPKLKTIKLSLEALKNPDILPSIEQWINPTNTPYFNHFNLTPNSYRQIIDDNIIDNLIKSPLLSFIRDFSLTSLTEQQVQKIFSSQFAPMNGTIITLKMNRVIITPFYIPFLSQSSAMSGLEFLDLTGCKLTNEVLGSIIQSPFFGHLSKLNLDGNPALTDEIILQLSQTPLFSSLTHLSLSNCGGLTMKSLRYIGESPYLGKLTQFTLPPLGKGLTGEEKNDESSTLSKGFIGEENHKDFLSFINSPNLINLKSFKLVEVTISLDTIRAIAQSKVLCNLETLAVSWCEFPSSSSSSTHQNDGDGDEEEGNHFPMNPFGLFGGRNNGHDDEEEEDEEEEEEDGNNQDDPIAQLLTSPYLSKLKALGLSKLPKSIFNNRHLKILSQSPTMSNLQNLSISWNEGVTNQGVKSLFNPQNSVLKKLSHLNLGDCWRLNDNVIRYLIKYNPELVGQLERLIVDNTEMEDYEDLLRHCGWWSGDFE